MPKNGVVYTPQKIVDLMKSNIDFSNKSILEPSCGEGVFLTNINDYEKIHAFDIDKNSILKAKKILNKDVIFFNEDFLLNENEEKYDIIIGNPPYIKTHDLDKSYLEKLKNKFISLNFGSVDYYYAFIEASLKKLKDKGELIFIIPNNWLVNKSAKELRNILIQYDIKIYDFLSEKVFEGYNVYTCILHVYNQNKNTSIKLIDKTGEYSIEKIKDIPWIRNNEKSNKKMPNIKNGIATLSDKSFIFNTFEELDEKTYSIFSRATNSIFKIEKEMFKPIIKGSTFEKGIVLFPYTNGKPFSENYIKQNFPLCYSYLTKIKNQLLQRDYDKEWFLFGRSQSTNSFGKKIVLSPLIENKINYIFVDEETIVYSGLYIIYNDEKEKSNIEEILNDKNLLSFIKNNGKKFGSGWTGFSKTILSMYFEK